jgi:opacity protein-like surface antigen
MRRAAITLLPAFTLVLHGCAARTPPAQPDAAAATSASLATPTGHEVNVSLSGYDYVEPGTLNISLHGAKAGAEYTGTLPINGRRHWFAQANARGTVGNVTYDGWCLPWLITPDGASPNGYALDLGDPSPCSESGYSDWFVEFRGLTGKDVIGRRWALSPYAGVGFRHLSNGTAGIDGFRTQDYLYLPFGITLRTGVRSQRALSFNLEYDYLLHGWQTTRNSALGGGLVPATPTAPAFVIEGLSDVSFAQDSGWALRAGAKYDMTRRWSVEPYYVHWQVGDSSVSTVTATFTVNDVTARQQFSAYEPLNTTDEFGVKVGLRF